MGSHDRSERGVILVVFMRGAETESVRGALLIFRVVFWNTRGTLEESADVFSQRDKIRMAVRSEKRWEYGRLAPRRCAKGRETVSKLER